MAFVKPTYQDAFVHVSVLHVETDPDDAAVVDLLVVQRQWQGRVVGHGRDGAFVRAWGGERGGAGDRGGGSTAGARGWTGAGTCSWCVQWRQRRALPKLEGARAEKRWWRWRSGAPRSHQDSYCVLLLNRLKRLFTVDVVSAAGASLPKEATVSFTEGVDVWRVN